MHISIYAIGTEISIFKNILYKFLCENILHKFINKGYTEGQMRNY
jgi:hypothetical protein